jgi:hypothetical protein
MFRPVRTVVPKLLALCPSFILIPNGVLLAEISHRLIKWILHNVMNQLKTVITCLTSELQCGRMDKWEYVCGNCNYTYILASGTPSSRVQSRPKPLDFSGVVKILKHAFLQRGSKICFPCPQLCGHVKEPSNFVNYGLLAKFLGISSVLR